MTLWAMFLSPTDSGHTSRYTILQKVNCIDCTLCVCMCARAHRSRCVIGLNAAVARSRVRSRCAADGQEDGHQYSRSHSLTYGPAISLMRSHTRSVCTESVREEMVTKFVIINLFYRFYLYRVPGTGIRHPRGARILVAIVLVRARRI